MDDVVYSPVCADPVTRPLMRNDWTSLTFLHWRYDPADVQRLLPPELTVETFQGAAWVALVPFAMRVATPGDRAVPWLTTFLETNVRTYVRGPDGATGVWFFSLETDRLHVTAFARAAFGVPYCWAEMSLTTRGNRVVYDARRRWPRPFGARSHVEVEVGVPYVAGELGPFEHFCTARYQVYARRRRGGVLRTRVDHEPWVLRRAVAPVIDDHLVAACGLPAAGRPPESVLYAERLPVKLAVPRRVPGKVRARG